MAESPLLLTDLSEAQRAQALERYTIIRPALEKEISQAQIARTHHLPPSTVQLWIKRYREKGFAGLANAKRSDKGKSRSLPEQAIQLVEGLALQTPPRSAAAIHRQVSAIALEKGWNPPSYERVRQIIKHIAPPLVTLAHEGVAAYREEFDLLYRREAPHANAMWQTDHTPSGICPFRRFYGPRGSCNDFSHHEREYALDRAAHDAGRTYFSGKPLEGGDERSR